MQIKWVVRVKSKTVKDLGNPKKIPSQVANEAYILFKELAAFGPAVYRPNYGKLRNQGKGIDRRHCHLRKGKPTWVACWEVESENYIIEVYYVGTHEKAPY